MQLLIRFTPVIGAQRVPDPKLQLALGECAARSRGHEIKACDVSLAVGFALTTPSCLELADDRKLYCRHCRTIAFANLSDFLAELSTVVPESEHNAVLADTVAAWNDADGPSKKASQDIFTARLSKGALTQHMLSKIRRY